MKKGGSNKKSQLNLIIIFLICFWGLCGCGVKESSGSSGLQTTGEQVTETEQTVAASEMQTTEELSDVQAKGKAENDLAHKEYAKYIKEKTIDTQNNGYDPEFKEYAFFDIDGNGVDELITSGNVSNNYAIYTYSGGEIIDLLRAADVEIYSDSQCVFSKVGRFDIHSNLYSKIDGKKCETVAEEIYIYTHENDTDITSYEYKVMGKTVEKDEYEEYVNSITKGSVVTEQELYWNKVKILEEG